MKIIYGIDKIRKFRKPVVALGVFDGVHIGHRHILKAAVEKARRIGGTSMVVTFWPDPHREQSIYSLEHRLRLIGA
ncbi:MAG: adenylyltransferase/cytidyltransferase family protein, partial [Candidatus Omnitrophota bacterium]